MVITAVMNLSIINRFHSFTPCPISFCLRGGLQPPGTINSRLLASSYLADIILCSSRENFFAKNNVENNNCAVARAPKHTESWLANFANCNLLVVRVAMGPGDPPRRKKVLWIIINLQPTCCVCVCTVCGYAAASNVVWTVFFWPSSCLLQHG